MTFCAPAASGLSPYKNTQPQNRGKLTPAIEAGKFEPGRTGCQKVFFLGGGGGHLGVRSVFCSCAPVLGTCVTPHARTVWVRSKRGCPLGAARKLWSARPLVCFRHFIFSGCHGKLHCTAVH